MATGLFVTGTGTDVGKTVLSAALTAAMRASGLAVAAHKPAVSGFDALTGEWPADHVLLGITCEMPPEQVSPLRYGQPLSPHLAARLAGAPVEDAQVIAAATTARDAAAQRHAALIVEGVGGLLVPLTDTLTVRALAVELGLPMLIAASPGLGTINHTLLTLEAARAVNLEVRAVVLTPWPAEPSAVERSNRETIERLGEVEVMGLPHISAPGLRIDSATEARLAAAGDALPWRRWLDESPATP
jgi:dethiobiotin synthetase